MYDPLYFALFAYFDFQKSSSELLWKFTEFKITISKHIPQTRSAKRQEYFSPVVH